ncbi:MAG: TadE family protein [Gemmatimonadota bacterium]
MTLFSSSPLRTRSGARSRFSRGQSLVEMALVLPVLFTLFFGIFEFGRHFYTRLTVRQAVGQATRFAVTGRASTDSNGDPLSRAETVRLRMEDSMSHLNIVVDSIFLDPPDGGGPEEVVQVGVTYRYQFSMPGMHRFFPEMTFTVKTAMRNEPYFE